MSLHLHICTHTFPLTFTLSPTHSHPFTHTFTLTLTYKQPSTHTRSHTNQNNDDLDAYVRHKLGLLIFSFLCLPNLDWSHGHLNKFEEIWVATFSLKWSVLQVQLKQKSYSSLKTCFELLIKVWSSCRSSQAAAAVRSDKKVLSSKNFRQKVTFRKKSAPVSAKHLGCSGETITGMTGSIFRKPSKFSTRGSFSRMRLRAFDKETLKQRPKPMKWPSKAQWRPFTWQD